MPPLSILTVAIIAVIIWGGSPVAAKLAVLELPALTVAILRTVVGGLFALPLALIMRVPLPKQRDHCYLLLLSGFCGFVAFPIGFTYGVSMTSANHAAMALAALPITTGAIASLWDRSLPPKWWWLGCAIALLGESILISDSGGGSAGATVLGDVVVLLANFFASLGYVAGAKLQAKGYPTTGITFWGVSCFGVLLLPLVFFVGQDVDLSKVSDLAWGGVIYLAIGVTIIGYLMWYWALGQGGIARMGLTQFLQPVSGVLLAAAFLREPITMVLLISSIAILLGVWIAMRPK